MLRFSLQVVSKVPQGHEKASNEAEASEYLHMTLVPHQQPAEVLQMSKGSLDLPAASITNTNRCKGPASPGLLSLSPREVRNRRLDAPASEPGAKLPAVIGFVSHQLPGAGFGSAASLRHIYGSQRRLRKLYLVRRRALKQEADGNAAALGDKHQFRAFAALGLTDGYSPLLAGTKLPSRKACAHSNLPCASKLESTARHKFSQTPASSHSLSRRHAVVGEPSSLGKSFQRQPVRRTNRMASNVRRSSARGRPIVFWGGRSGAIRSHWSSVKRVPVTHAVYKNF